MAKRTLGDEPTISKKEALVFFNMGKATFAEKWGRVFQYKIRHVETSKGRKLSLMDVIRVAFPDASSQTAHLMALHYLMSLRAERRSNRVAVIKEHAEKLIADGEAA